MRSWVAIYKLRPYTEHRTDNKKPETFVIFLVSYNTKKKKRLVGLK